MQLTVSEYNRVSGDVELLLLIVSLAREMSALERRSWIKLPARGRHGINPAVVERAMKMQEVILRAMANTSIRGWIMKVPTVTPAMKSANART